MRLRPVPHLTFDLIRALPAYANYLTNFFESVSSSSKLPYYEVSTMSGPLFDLR
jgi:hypothetical protein